MISCGGGGGAGSLGGVYTGCWDGCFGILLLLETAYKIIKMIAMIMTVAAISRDSIVKSMFPFGLGAGAVVSG